MSDAALLNLLAECPSHVDPARVVDFDMFRDPGLNADPHQRLLELAGTAPEVFWTPRNGGHWVIIGQRAVRDAARDTDTFSNEAIPHAQLLAMIAATPPGAPRIPIPYPLMLDPPLHHVYRQPLQTAFSPTTVMGLADSIRTLAAELIDAIVPTGRCEFMAAVAEPLPVKVFLRMFGLPLERLPEYRALVRESLAQQADSSPEAGMKRLIRLVAIMRDELLARRDDPRDDLISLLWSVDIGGRPMSIDDVENYAVLLFIAGLDTVMNSMGYAAHHLACDPDLQARLRADPSLIPIAAEEMLRCYSFVVVPRRVNRDTSFRGVAFKADDRVMLHIPAANLDPAAYPDPGRYDLDRDSKSHVAFNAGPHRCLGAHLARLELHVFYEELLKRLPTFRLDPQRPTTYVCSQIIGIDKLYLAWNP